MLEHVSVLVPILNLPFFFIQMIKTCYMLVQIVKVNTETFIIRIEVCTLNVQNWRENSRNIKNKPGAVKGNLSYTGINHTPNQ